MKYKTAQPEEVKEGEIIRRSFSSGVVKSINVDKRQVDFVISTEAVDRVGDIIRVDGWDLKQYRKNPVVLFGHNSSIPPIGRAPKVWKEEGALKATAQFMPEDISPFGYSIFRMYEERYLNAVSVGFMPTKWEFIRDDENEYITGIDFLKQELYEFSAVPIPANPEALIDARGKGINTKPFKDWAEEQLDNWKEAGSTIQKLYGADRKDLELIRRKAAGTGMVLNVPLALQEELRRKNLAASEQPRNEDQKGASMNIKTGFVEVAANKVDDLKTQAKEAGFSLIKVKETKDQVKFLALPTEEKADQKDHKPVEVGLETVDNKEFLTVNRTPDHTVFNGGIFETAQRGFVLEEKDGGVFVRIEGSDRIATYKLTGATEEESVSAELVDVQPGTGEGMERSEQTETTSEETQEDVEEAATEETAAEETTGSDADDEDEDETGDEDEEDEKAAKEENKKNKQSTKGNGKAKATPKPAKAEDDDEDEIDEDEERSLDDTVMLLESILPDFEEALDKTIELGQSPRKSTLRKMKFLAGYMKELALRVSPELEVKEVKSNGTSDDDDDGDYISLSDIDKVLAEKLQPKLAGIITAELNKARGRLPETSQ